MGRVFIAVCPPCCQRGGEWDGFLWFFSSSSKSRGRLERGRVAQAIVRESWRQEGGKCRRRNKKGEGTLVLSDPKKGDRYQRLVVLFPGGSMFGRSHLKTLYYVCSWRLRPCRKWGLDLFFLFAFSPRRERRGRGMFFFFFLGNWHWSLRAIYIDNKMVNLTLTCSTFSSASHREVRDRAVMRSYWVNQWLKVIMWEALRQRRKVASTAACNAAKNAKYPPSDGFRKPRVISNYPVGDSIEKENFDIRMNMRSKVFERQECRA